MHTSDQLNSALADRYAINRRIGEGGMATVYLARDLKHNRRVALKVLKPDLGAVVGVERFLAEIEVTANLQHPNLLPLFDSGAAGDLLFYVMPYVEGESLRARLDREKQLPIDEAVRIATSVASALDYAHRHGVVHRDLKPENILIHDGQPVVADFGIALALSNAGGNRITQTGVSLGTPQYMSPEQATGDRTVDARTDIYSLGAMTYEMLTGEPPHIGPTSQAVIARLLTEKPRPVHVARPNVPAHIDAAVERALEKLPADRWPTAKEFSEALTGARPVLIPERAGPTPSRAASARPTTASRARSFAWPAATVVSLVVAVALAIRADDPAPALVAAEFTVQLPDGLSPAVQTGRAAGAPQIAISRDGSRLVFKATRPGATPALYDRRLGDRTAQIISGTEGVTGNPALSPNGDEVAYVDGESLKRISVRGGTPRVLADAGSNPSWGDAGYIVFSRGSALWIVSEDGGATRLLAAPDSTRRHRRYGYPHILPGGKVALISIWRGSTINDSVLVGTITIPDGKVTELEIRGMYPRYSGTGHVLYATLDHEILAVPFSARSLRPTGQSFLVAEGVQTGPGGGAGFAVSSDGTLAYLGGGEGAQRGRSLVAVTRGGVERPLSVKAGYYQNPRVSPDGNQIAFTVYGGPGSAIQLGPDPDVWRADIRSGLIARVTTDSASFRPAWSADGERIAYIRSGGDSVVKWRALYVAGPPTPLVRSTRRITNVAMGLAHGYLVVQVADGMNNSSDLMVVHSDSLLPPRPLMTEPHNEDSPRISPDGHLVAYRGNQTGRNEVYVRALQGEGPEVRVSVDGGTEPVWAPNSRELFYRAPLHLVSARLTDRPRLDVVRWDTLFRDPYLRSGTANYDVFPNGKEFVMLRAAAAPAQPAEIPLIVVLNWTARSNARPGARAR
jgi:serine/threonine-protein kinase